MILGVKTVEDRNTSLEPHMVALDFKTVFLSESIKVTTNWKTDTGWQGEEIVDSDWVDTKGSNWRLHTFPIHSDVVKDFTNYMILKKFQMSA